MHRALPAGASIASRSLPRFWNKAHVGPRPKRRLFSVSSGRTPCVREAVLTIHNSCSRALSSCTPVVGDKEKTRNGGLLEGDRFASSQTVVRHPPAPGWEFPPVPNGCKPKFAVIELGNTQHKVTKDDVIVADKIKGADIGTTLDIENVLLVGSPEETVVGRPVVKGALVKLLVEEQTKDKKIIVFKKRRRKSSKTTQGHRREVTLLRVTDILS